jgi:hypothetical protein
MYQIVFNNSFKKDLKRQGKRIKIRFFGEVQASVGGKHG